MAHLVDTSVLARLANTADPFHVVAAQAVLELHRRGEVLHVTSQNLVEFRNMATRPKAVNGLGLAPVEHETALTFRLNRKKYDELRHRSQVPRLLVVLLLPRQPAQWIEQNDERLISNYAAYYVSLAGMADAPQRGKVPVELPRANLLSVDALRRLMEQASQRVRKLS